MPGFVPRTPAIFPVMPELSQAPAQRPLRPLPSLIFASRWLQLPLYLGLIAAQTCQFALQPIVEPSEGKISSLEALIRSNDGGSPDQFFRALDPDTLYQVDLQTKAYAFALAEKLGIGSHKIAVNLLPMSLVNVPGAVEFLVGEIKKHGLQPEQVVLEITVPSPAPIRPRAGRPREPNISA